MKLYVIEKIAPIGSLIAAAGCPVCFPALAGLGSALGLGLFARFESQFLILMQMLIIVSLFLAFVSYKRTHNKISLAFAVLSGGILFVSWYVYYVAIIYYMGMFGLIITAGWNFWLESKLSTCAQGVCDDGKVLDTAQLTCPYCQYIQEIKIPQTGCLAFHSCHKCKKLISVPQESKNCCVICEYADKKCPVAV